jgi:hypothetical protein
MLKPTLPSARIGSLSGSLFVLVLALLECSQGAIDGGDFEVALPFLPFINS